MKTHQHAERAERVLRSMQKLGPGDYEMQIEAAMIAGTQLFNVCLHKLGVTAEADDIMHSEYLSGHQRIRIKLLSPGLAELLDEIEQLRPTYVRGDFEQGEKAAERCLTALRQLHDRAKMLEQS